MVKLQKTCLIVLVVMAALLSPAAFATDYYVATNGSDNSAGTIGAPFATIQKAADTMNAGDTCYIRGGTYRESVSLSRSGSSGNLITFKNYRAEKVVIDGTDILNLSWSVHSGNIYQATTTAEFDQLFADSDMMVEARWPNASKPTDVFKNSTWATVDNGSKGNVTDSAIGGTGINWVGAYGAFNLGQQMHTWVRKVKTQNSNTITYDTNGVDTGLGSSWDDDRYYLFGKHEALDTANEWFLDSGANTLYFWTPDGTTPANYEIAVKQRTYAFDAAPNTNYIKISGLNLFGCEFLFEENCNYITISDCHLLYPNYSRTIPQMYAGGAISNFTPNFSGHDITIENCSIAYSLIGALYMKGSYFTIENNLIHDCLLNGSNTFATIYIVAGDANTIYDDGSTVVSNNTIYEIGNVAIKFKHRDSFVQYNDLSRGGLASKDTTLLYTAQVHPYTAYQYNWLHDESSFDGGGLGFRIDGGPETEGSLGEDLTVRGNVTWNCGGPGFIIKGRRNKVYHNTVIDEFNVKFDTHQNSEMYNNFANSYSFDSGATQGGVGYWGYNSSVASPGFENKDLRNFTPSSSSSLVNGGISSRPGYSWTWNGTAPDQGAYERGQAYWVPGYMPIRATDPYPNEGQEKADPDVTFSWDSSLNAASYDIYLGTSYTAVLDATTASSEYKANQSATTYNPAGVLTANTTYYWRIDSRDSGNNIIAYGDVWKIKTGASGTYYHPVAWWKFDEAGGTTAIDASTNHNTAFMTNATWTEGQIDGCLNFGSGDYVSVPVDAISGISNQITVTLWQNGDAAVQPINSCIFQAVNSAGSRLLNSHLPYGNGSVYWDAGYASGSYDRINKAATAGQYEGQWNHWAFTKNTSTGSMKIYLNGVLWHSGTGKTKSMSGITTFKIGAATDNTLNYDGMIDDFRVYNVELGVTDINAIYMEGFPQAAAVTESFNPTEDTYKSIPYRVSTYK